MGLWLKQSTAIDLQVGPFLDTGDADTEEGGLTITQGDVLLSKNGGAWAQKNDATACTVDATNAAFYKCPLNATDTGTLGRLQVSIHESGALIAYHEFMVVTAHVYDSHCGSDYQQVDVIQVGSTTQTATDLKDFADTGYDPATHKVAGVVLTDTTTAVTNTVNLSAASEAQIDAIETDTNELQTDLTDGGRLDLLIDATLADTNELQTDWTDGGRLDLLLDATLADTNELQTDWANGGRLDLLIDAILLDTGTTLQNDITAIKAITDLLVLADIADAVLDEVVDANAGANANSLRENINIIASVLAGKSSGGGTGTIVFKDLGDTKNRISATVDANGNRTAIGTQDGT